MTTVAGSRPYDDTLMAAAGGHDLVTAARLIEERWKLYYPRIDYYPLDKAVTNVDQQTEALTGEDGSTQFDPLWGEAVPATLRTTGWQQPHLSAQTTNDPVTDPADGAADPEIRRGPFAVHMRVQRTMHENMLKKLGFDRVRTLIATIPSSMVARYAVIPQPGDRFRWNDEWYDVEQTVGQGWYKNTTVRLYWVLNVQSARQGS